MPMIGNYELIGPVGTGSTSTVWKARDVRLDRPVALKRLDHATPLLREQWRAEARVLATLDEPHVVEVYGFEEDDDSAYIVEQWVDGATLAAVLARASKLSTAQALGVIRGALLGLAHAHERGVVHRDVSTRNILVDQSGTSRLIDFGMAAGSGAVGSFGTSAYRSPEASTDQPATPASDVYSAAAVLTHLLTGVAATPPAVDTVDPTLRAVVRRALALDPADRFADARAFLEALEEAAQQRYGASWWTEAGMAALVSSAGVGVVATAVGRKSAAPATALAGGTLAAQADSIVIRAPGGKSKRAKFAAAGAAAAVVLGGVGAAVASSQDEDRGNRPAFAAVTSSDVTPSPAVSSAVITPTPTPTSTPALSVSPSPVPPTPTPTATPSKPAPRPARARVSPAQALTGTFGLSGAYTSVGVRLIDDATRKVIGPGSPIATNQWTVKAACTAANRCTANVVSNSGARYTLVLSGGRWRGRSSPIVQQCYDAAGRIRAQTGTIVVDIDIPDPSAKLARIPAKLAGTQRRTYGGQCGGGSGGVATASLVLTRK